LGEITYFAFGIPSPEFHDELWGEIHCLIDPGSEHALNRALNTNHGLDYKKTWIRDNTNPPTPEQATLPYYIRSSSHHPENRLNDPYTYDELAESTEELIAVLKALQSTSASKP